MFRQQTKTLKNCIMDDRSGAGYMVNALKPMNRPERRQLKNNAFNIKGANAKKNVLYLRIFKATARRRQFKILSRQL